MSAGELNKLIQFEWLVPDGRSDSGEKRDEWIPDDKPVWAKVEDLRGHLYFAADQANSKATARVRIYRRADIESATGKTLRINIDGRIYIIDGAPIRLNDGMKLELMVYERT